MCRTIDMTMPHVPTDYPRYVMGVGKPIDLVEAVARGVDMFDCVLPSRNARHGLIYTREGIRNMKNLRYAKDFTPLDPDSDLFVDQYYSKAYLRHLLKANEYLAFTIMTMHNLGFFLWLVGEARKHILNGDFASWKAEMVRKVRTKL